MLGSKRTLRLARILTASTLHVVLSGARLALEAGLAGADRGLLAVGYLQLVEDVGDVVGDRLRLEGNNRALPLQEPILAEIVRADASCMP